MFSQILRAMLGEMSVIMHEQILGVYLTDMG
jgi:hypothetical protein